MERSLTEIHNSDRYRLANREHTVHRHIPVLTAFCLHPVTLLYVAKMHHIDTYLQPISGTFVQMHEKHCASDALSVVSCLSARLVLFANLSPRSLKQATANTNSPTVKTQREC